MNMNTQTQEKNGITVKIGDVKKQEKITFTVPINIEIDCEIAFSSEMLAHAIAHNWQTIKTWKEEGDEDYEDYTEESSKLQFFKNYPSDVFDWLEYDGFNELIESKTDKEVLKMVNIKTTQSEIQAAITESIIEFLNANNHGRFDFK